MWQLSIRNNIKTVAAEQSTKATAQQSNNSAIKRPQWPIVIANTLACSYHNLKYRIFSNFA